MAAAEPDAPSALESAMRPPSGTYLHLSRRIVLRVLAGLVVLALLAVLLGIVVVRRSFPTTDGEISLPGLDAQVTVTRDGSLAAHFEHTVAVSDSGAEVLTRRDAEVVDEAQAEASELSEPAARG